MIRKEGNQFVLYSRDGKKKLGTHATLMAAQRQERAIRGITNDVDIEEKPTIMEEWRADIPGKVVCPECGAMLDMRKMMATAMPGKESDDD